MRVRILQTTQSGSQTINAGVLADVPDTLARDWIERGLAQALEPESAPVIEAVVNAPVADAAQDQPAPRARRAKG